MAAGALIGGFMGGGSNSGASSGSGAGGADAAANPVAAQAAAMGSGLDGSGWVVQFGNGNTSSLDNRQDKHIDSTGPTATAIPTASASAAQRAAMAPYYDTGLYGGGGVGGDPLGLGALGLGGISPVVWLILGGAVLIRLTRKH
jgi:hypothetical protein